MNKKLRIFLCSLFSVIAIFALAFAVGCDNETVSSASESTSVSDSGTENTGSEESSGETTPDYDFANATWSWTENSDGSYSVTVTVKDNNGGTDLTVTADNVTVTSAVKTAATCTSKGTTTYTATFTYGGNTYTATKDFDDIAIDPDNHAEELTLVEGVASTDDADGTIAYYYCSACKSMYADSTGKTALSATDIVIAHKASSVPEAISMPTAASTTATTSAVLNSSDSSFDLEYEVTVSGTYTITLVCEDLHDLSVGVYNSWYGSTPVGTLQDAESYTISYDYAAGETLEIYALLSTTKLYPVTFSVEISYTEKSVTRPVAGYYQDGAIYIGSPYSYSADMTVTADDDSSNTLYYYTYGSYSGIDLTLTVTSSDTTFTVYGYTTDSATEYSVWTLDSNGSYDFTVTARKYAYIKITCDSLTTSGAASGTISVSLAEAEKEATYLEEKTYSVSSYDTIELVAQTAGYYTFKVDENGEVKLTVEGSTETYTDNNGYTMTYDDGRYFGSDEGEYEVTVYIGANVNVSLYGYSASSVTVTYSAGESGGTEDTLTLDNAVKLTQDSDEYAEYTLTFTTAGTYMIMFTVDESSEVTVAEFASSICDASFTIGSAFYTYTDVVVSSDSTYCYIQFTVSESDLGTVTFKLGVVQAVTYSATVTAVKAEEGGESGGTEEGGDQGGESGDDNKEVMTEGSALTVSLSEDLTYVEAILEVETSGYYTVTVSGTDSANVYVIIGNEDQLYYYDTRITSTTYIVDYNVTSEDLPIEIEEGATLSVTIALVYGATSADVSVTIALDENYGETTVTGVDAVMNISSIYSAEATISSETSLYSGTDGTAVSVTASSDSTVSVDSNKKSIDEYSFTYRLKLSGTGSADARSLKITTVGACTILVYMMSSSSSSTRTVNLYDSTYTQISGQSKTVQGVAISCYAFTVSAAGTYYIGSAKDGLNVYGLVIDYDCSTLSVAESVAVTGTATTLAAGETTTLTATVSMTEGTTYTGSYVWVTSDSDATSVSSSGVVTAKSVTEDTEVTITVSTNEGVIATYKITITTDISAVSE